MRLSGFSLIEVMVVIAIVAALAAVALPAYKSYILKAKLNQVSVVIDNLQSQSIALYNKNGVWPDLYDFAYGYVSFAEDNPTAISPLLARIEVDGGEATTDCNYTYMYLTLNSAQFPGDIIQEDDTIVISLGQPAGSDVILKGCNALDSSSDGLIANMPSCAMTIDEATDITCP